MLSYGVTGVLRDRRVPAWSLHVPGLRRNVPFVTPHCTVVLGCYPGVDGLRGGLDNVLRLRSDASGDEAVHLDAAADGTYVPVMKPLAPVVDVADELPGTEVAEPQYEGASTPTIAQRLSRRTAHPHEGDNRVGAELDFAADDTVLLLEESTLHLRKVNTCSSLHSSMWGGAATRSRSTLRLGTRRG